MTNIYKQVKEITGVLEIIEHEAFAGAAILFISAALSEAPPPVTLAISGMTPFILNVVCRDLFSFKPNAILMTTVHHILIIKL